MTKTDAMRFTDVPPADDAGVDPDVHLTDPTTTPTPLHDRELLDRDALAAYLSVSPSHVSRLDSAGRIPRPIRLGGSVRWHRPTIDAWLAECARTGETIDRAEWAALTAGNAKANGRP